jgi:isopropylmalate/homocitrate/citramalate synthase
MEKATMPQSLKWRFSVSLRDGAYAQIATMDFARRETIELQLVQLLFKQNDIQ